ncbi:efflux RND transporter permease subunit [Pseudodesulfovibrio senegalensis]|uniref:Efflux RND transporter permease subunit n=1 Tax=Pseudodesulfovibrio senegalensis TaxID=1721087 RepID=A0A6N6N0G8_9BACT|nr:efflux RND transporter permease subunit [Pseudodesulfovibrio senegalensis]KAB1440392.1 efflux RND transporter permease subunit [Pseudodesulfovibrio senegalensis]
MKGKRSFLAFFAGHPTAANLLMLIFLVLGVLSLPKLVRETFPDFDPTEVEIVVPYPGATAEDVEESICQRIEDAIDGVTYLEEVRSTARENRGRVVAEMVEGGDMRQFLDDVKTEVEAIDDFPDQAEIPVIRQLGRKDAVVAVAVSGPMSLPHLKLYCEQLKDRMLRDPRISLVRIEGFSDHQIRIEVPAEKLMQYGLSMSEITDVIGRQNVDLPAGTVLTRDADILVRFADQRRSVEGYRDLVVVSGRTGAEVRLGDIASVQDTFELDEDKFIFDGKRAGKIVVEKTGSEDSLRILDAVRDFVQQESAKASPGVSLVLTQNSTKIVRDRLNMLVENGIQGLLLVFAVMWLFFNIRLSFWVSLGLPVSFMGTFFLMDMGGLTLNMLTMVGLLLALGLIMDDAIVIAENISSHLQKGKSALQAAVDGTSEVAVGVVSSFATTVLIFGTIAVLIEGNIGKVLWVMPVVLIMTLAVSLVEAFCILPNHLEHSLRSMPSVASGFRRSFEARFEKVRESVLGRAVDWAVQWRYLVVGGVFALLFISVGMLAGGVLKTKAFPDIEGDIVQARILLPQGTPLERTESIVGRLVDALGTVNKEYAPQQPEGQPLVQNVTIQYNQNQDTEEAGPHVATISVDLLNAETRTTSIDDLTKRWRELVGNVPDVSSITYKEPAIGPAGIPLEIRLQGQDLDVLEKASNELVRWLRRYEGVYDVSDNLRPGKPELQLRLKPGATALGLDAQKIASQLRNAFYGRDATEVQDGPEAYEINVRLAREDRDSLGDVELFYVRTPGGKNVPLSSVAFLEQGRGFATISRVNSVRTATVQGDVDTATANANEVVADTVERFMPRLLQKYPGIEYTLEGQAKQGGRTGASLRKAILLGVLGIFVLLSFQFRSYIEPLVVIGAIPLAFIGVVWGHLLMGLDLSMVSIMGFASLAGIVVNDSILLVEFVKRHMCRGMSAHDASMKASRQRFRAVLLTSLTTIVGLVPLLSERSLQAQVLIPLCTSIVFGLLTSTVLVLVVLPALYSILDDFGLTSRACRDGNFVEPNEK